MGRMIRMVAFLTTWAGAAGLAAAGDGFKPPPQEQGFSLWALLYTLVAAAAVAVVGFRNAKRTHLD